MRFCRIFNPVTKSIRKYYFIPVINRMSPEFGIPCFVQFIQCLIFFTQPDSESFLTIFAVAFSTILVADMPAGYMWIVPVTLGKLSGQTGCKLLKHKGIRASIMTLSEFVMSSLIISPCDLRITLYHPCRQRCC